MDVRNYVLQFLVLLIKNAILKVLIIVRVIKLRENVEAVVHPRFVGLEKIAKSNVVIMVLFRVMSIVGDLLFTIGLGLLESA